MNITKNKHMTIGIITPDSIGKKEYALEIRGLFGKESHNYGAYENGLYKTKKYDFFIIQREGIKGPGYDGMIQQIRDNKEIVGQLDHVFFHTSGPYDLEVAKEFSEFPAEKMTYISCDCNLEEKLEKIKDLGHEKSKMLVEFCPDICSMLEKILKNPEKFL
jgi:hypothetical protein